MSTEQEKNTERYLSTGELMDVLSISRSTVYRLIAKGMPNIMVGSVHRFPSEQVLTWLRGNYGGTSGDQKWGRDWLIVGLSIDNYRDRKNTRPSPSFGLLTVHLKN